MFILYYKYDHVLEITEVEEVYDVTPDGKEHTYIVPSIDNFDTWDKVIKEVEDIVYPNIHLLMRKDVHLWNEFLDYSLKESERDYEIIEPYLKFKKFFKEITLSYIKLYNVYHMEIKSVKSANLVREEVFCERHSDHDFDKWFYNHNYFGIIQALFK